MAAARFLACLLASLALAGCAATDDEATPTQPARTTNSEVASAVWERSYSECATEPLPALAAKYNVEQTIAAVSTAVATSWQKRFDAGDDTIANGIAGCRQGFETS